MDQLFLQIGIVIIIASCFAYITRLFKQPMIPAYILTGLLIGPFSFGLIKDPQLVTSFSEIGIAFLLFVVGLELDLKKLKDIGLVATIGGTLQIFILFSLGYLIAVITGAFSSKELFYIGLVLAFSSTMVVVKLLSDKKALDTLHGRIILGVLLMEDICAIISLSLLSTQHSLSAGWMAFSILKAAAVFAAAVFVSKFIFPTIFKFAARSQELLFLMSITICFVFSMLADYLGFSIAIGGFIGGIALASLPYNMEIISRIKPLRDFFMTMFFVTLGMQMPISGIGRIIVPSLCFLAFIIIFKPLVTMAICSFFGYTRRTSFMTAISLPHISEFGLIIVAQGLAIGDVSVQLASLAVMLTVVTLTWTTYLSKYDTALYNMLSSKMTLFSKLAPEAEELGYNDNNKKYDVILVGYDRIGYSIAKTLKSMGRSSIIVDYNPDTIKELAKAKISCIYGDITDPEIIERLNFTSAKTVVSTVPELHSNLELIKRIKQGNGKTAIIVTANKVDEALRLYNYGADYVILPHFLGGEHASKILEEMSDDFGKVMSTKLKHIQELKLRKELGHEHPRNEQK